MGDYFEKTQNICIIILNIYGREKGGPNIIDLFLFPKRFIPPRVNQIWIFSTLIIFKDTCEIFLYGP